MYLSFETSNYCTAVLFFQEGTISTDLFCPPGVTGLARLVGIFWFPWSAQMFHPYLKFSSLSFWLEIIYWRVIFIHKQANLENAWQLAIWDRPPAANEQNEAMSARAESWLKQAWQVLQDLSQRFCCCSLCILVYVIFWDAQQRGSKYTLEGLAPSHTDIVWWLVVITLIVMLMALMCQGMIVYK